MWSAADKATTLDAARSRAGRLKAALESRAVHTEVLNYCRAELVSKAFSIQSPIPRPRATDNRV